MNVCSQRRHEGDRGNQKDVNQWKYLATGDKGNTDRPDRIRCEREIESRNGHNEQNQNAVHRSSLKLRLPTPWLHASGECLRRR